MLELPPGQDATFEEMVAAAEWRAGKFDDSFDDTNGAARILGVSAQ